MGAVSVNLDISYSQLAVFHDSLDQPFNSWTEMHSNQGFAWRDRSVSFRTLDDGPHVVDVVVASRPIPLEEMAIRAIEVPFAVPAEGVEIASISDSVALELPPADYSLRCECFAPDRSGRLRIKLTFEQSGAPRFAVLRSDAELHVPEKLLLTATPAE